MRPATLDGLLICPRCTAPLALAEPEIQCHSCQESYPVHNGIPCFADPDPFYDDYADVHCPYTPSPKGWRGAVLRTLPFWSYREWRFWRDAVPACGRLLDLGCGRGKEIFIERADITVGLDGSLVFLDGCIEHYDAAVLASLPRLPFASDSFDVVVSSHVLGHVTPTDKVTLIAEIARVLRPGGTTAHIIETDSRHRAMRAAKAHASSYHTHIIEQDGHIGLEYASAVLRRFAEAGLHLTALRWVDAIIPSPMYYDKHLNHPGFEHLPGLRWSRALARLNRFTRLGNLAFEFGFGAFHRTVEQWLGNPDHANFIHVAFVKPPTLTAR